MKSVFLLMVVSVFLWMLPAAFGETEGDSLFRDPYVGASGTLLMPQGGSSLRRLGGATLRGGVYVSDFVAVEGEAAWLEDAAGLGVRTLLHAQAWRTYGDLFGYSAFDPFVTLGAEGWIGNHGAGQIGPQVGVGAFYHLDDRWSIRVDANGALGLDTEVEMVYTVSAGVQYAF